MANFEDLIIRDTRANQPAFGVAGRLYYVTDESVLERDSGSAWEDVSASADLSAYVAKELFDAQSVLAATSDDTPAALTVAEQTLVGRKTSGNVAALTATEVRTLLSVEESSSGWTALTDTWSYSSADAPTYVLSVDADVTAIIGVGQRLKLTNDSSVKYFIVTAVGAYGGGVTLITVYGGTDYAVVNSAITLPYYSREKAPFGFPLDPEKWSATLTDTTQRVESDPTQNTWYNTGSLLLSIPIGIWHVSYQALAVMGSGAAGSVYHVITLSTANNSESDTGFTSRVNFSSVPTGEGESVGHSLYKYKYLTLSSKTAYYLNQRTLTESVLNIWIRSDVSPTVIRALCAYL